MSKPSKTRRGPVLLFLDTIEWVGNRLPDPAVLFLGGIALIWCISAFLSGWQFTETVPGQKDPIKIVNLLAPESLASFLAGMTKTFLDFPPLGVVIVAMLGVGVAEHSGFINTLLKTLLKVTPKQLLTPMVIFVATLSHTAVDAGYVLVIPLAGIIFYAAGRHPLAGIAAAFAGVSGGFSANIIPSSLDPMLSGLTQTGARLIDKEYIVNPLCNWFFTGTSTLLVILLGWAITAWLIEPKLANTQVDGDPETMPKMPEVTPRDTTAMIVALFVVGLTVSVLAIWVLWPGSALQAKPPVGEEWPLYRRLTSMQKDHKAPLMDCIVPLIFVLFVIPGLVHGFVSGVFKTHRDAIKGMSKAMESLGYYIALVFFCALFIASFNQSQLGQLLAVKGANWLKAVEAPPLVTVSGIILLTASINLLIGSASAKWGLLGPIFVPMLMALGISPEFTQAAYRVGDSSTNIITPLMPYFPLVVVYCQRYVKSTGIGTLTSMMLPYSMTFLLLWSCFLFIWWQANIPLGIQGGFEYKPAVVQTAPAEPIANEAVSQKPEVKPDSKAEPASAQENTAAPSANSTNGAEKAK